MIPSVNCTVGYPAFTATSLGTSWAARFTCVDTSGDPTNGIPQLVNVQIQEAVPDPVSSFTDGAVLGWGVVAAMVAAYAIKLLQRSL
jgi:hypothetical protein